LLIALPTTLQRAKETLAKLDQPGREATQFETFPLKHAQADEARQVVADLFSTVEAEEGSSALAPKAQVIADSRTNSLIVRASPRDLAEVRALVNVIDRLGSQAVNELRIFRLQTTVAGDLASVLQEAITGSQDEGDSQLSRLLRLVTIDAEGQRQLESGVLASAQITASPSGNALIVSAPAESMPLLERLIAQLDQSPAAAIEMKIFPLENSDAASLVDTLSELFSVGSGDNGNSSEITRLRIEVDERTNSLLAAGTRDDLVTVEAILRTLDSTQQRERTSRVYRLSNKRAEDLA
jgi:type II secretory pathway component GspD/PulD (secretin)